MRSFTSNCIVFHPCQHLHLCRGLLVLRLFLLEFLPAPAYDDAKLNPRAHPTWLSRTLVPEMPAFLLNAHMFLRLILQVSRHVCTGKVWFAIR